METIAIYWEPVIKTYGIVEQTGLSLVSLPLSAPNAGSRMPKPSISDCLEAAKEWGQVRIVFAAGGPESVDGLRLNLLLAGKPPRFQDSATPHGLRVDAPVELVYFQGPHFGDRYGIAEAALGALSDTGISLLAMVCAGASVYIVVPEGTACSAAKVLRNAFAVPTSTRQTRPKSTT